ERAVRSGVRRISVFCAATETFSMANNRCSIEQNLQRIRSICNEALAHRIKVRAYLSCTLGCPYEGKVDRDFVAGIALQLLDSGCYEVSLGDTIGVGTAGSVQRLLEKVGRHIPLEKTAVHFHDTCGQALANVLSAIQLGVTVIDSSVAGLGGCPFAGNASGNLASEDLVYLLDGLGIETGIDLEQLVETAWYIADILGRPPESRVSRAIGRGRFSEFSKSFGV
ncbi:MAG: hydroxymethylglutaryl-CoA lyase, partial [Methylococcales bacterium]